jgi:large subunit ribosomal protein L24
MARKLKASIESAPKTIRIRKNDTVRVIAGRDKGKTGRVLEVNRTTGRVLVEGVQMIKRHTRPNPQRQIKGGIAEKESSIHVSNVMLLTPGGVPTRASVRVEGEGGTVRRTRVARKTGEVLETKKGK